MDDDLRELFKSWFNPGFLRLAKITLDTKAAVLEKIMKYERVHKIKDMDELKRRLGEDRRFFSYFHPALEDEPIIFVQVALTNTIKPNKFIYPRLKGVLTLLIILPLITIVVVPVTAIKKPTAAAVPIDFLMS